MAEDGGRTPGPRGVLSTLVTGAFMLVTGVVGLARRGLRRGK